MALKGKPIAIGTTDTTIYTCPASTEASVHGLVFANNTGSSATITLKIYINSLGTTTTVATGITVAANSTYTWPKPIDVNASDYIQAAASTGSAIVCLYSVYEGSAPAVAVGFTPRGTWSSAATYAINDVVSYSGSSYLAMLAGTNQQPDTATTYWMVLASKGATGSGDVTGPVASVDSELAIYSSTTGKVIKRATLTGLVKATSGVASAATAGTDYLAPPSGTAILKANSGGALANATAGTDYLAPTSPTITTPTISGNETHTGTAARFIADFDNATINSRFAFQTTTTNAITGIYALPNGTNTTARWEAANASDPTNASKIQITTNGSTDVQLVSGINGTGTYLPLSIYTNGGQSAQFSTTKGTFTLGVAGTAQGILNLTGSTSGTVSVQGAAAAGTWTFTLPTAVPGTAGSVLTSTTGGVSSWTATLPVANGGTGITSFGTGIATWLGTPSSANLASAITDETGSGALVFGTNPTITNYTEAVVAIGNTGTSKTIDLTSGTVQTATLTGNCTFTMPTATAGKSFILILTQDGTGGRTAVFTSVKWPAGSAPTITTTATTGRDILTFVSDGTNWYGTAAQAFA